MSGTFYKGANVSSAFMRRWRSKKYVGNAKPWARVSIRRGYLHHSLHKDWPNPQFGQVVGHHIRDQWYPTWTPTTDWVTLPGVSNIDLDQQMNYAGGGGNGICVASLTCDNRAWVQTAGTFGAYHVKQRGWLWPWRGWVPTSRPGGKVTDRNEWYDMLPNAQVLVEQGYGEDTAVKTFTGLIDTIGPGSIRPDRITLTARDFGGLLVDRYVFAWNKDRRMNDPVIFVPHDYPRLHELAVGKTHNWVVVRDAVDIVKCALRWSGFKEWQIESSGVGLKVAYPVDRSKTWMDVVNEVAAQLGYVFFIGEPSGDDLSMGVPVFRKRSVLRSPAPQPLALDSKIMTDIQPRHDNTSDRFIIRVRGALTTRAKGGRPIAGGDMTIDGQIRFTFNYWPPWMPRMAGVIKQLTYYNIGANGVLGFSSTQDCVVAAVLIAVEIALARDQATAQCPGQPAFGLDNFAFINDPKASGIVSRLYVTGRKSTMTLGGDGSSSGSSSTGGGSSQMIWSTELTGSLCDNPEFDHVISDYHKAITGRKVISSGLHGEVS